MTLLRFGVLGARASPRWAWALKHLGVIGRLRPSWTGACVQKGAHTFMSDWFQGRRGQRNNPEKENIVDALSSSPKKCQQRPHRRGQSNSPTCDGANAITPLSCSVQLWGSPHMRGGANAITPVRGGKRNNPKVIKQCGGGNAKTPVFTLFGGGDNAKTPELM